MSSHAGKRSLTSTVQTASPGDAQSTIGKRTRVEHPPAGSVQRSGAGDAERADNVHAAAAHGVATASTALPHYSMIQRAFGRHDISAVQAHVGAEARASADAMGADAYATGNHVVLGKGSDLFTTAHEAAHVVQQRGGVQLKGGVGEAGDAYERHADEVASLVVQGKSAEGLLDRYAGDGAAPAAGPVQRMDSPGGGPSNQPPGPTLNLNPADLHPVEPEPEEIDTHELHQRMAAQVAFVQKKVAAELAVYDEISRVLAEEHAAGRNPLGGADLARFDKLTAELEAVSHLLHEPSRGNDIAEAHRSTQMLVAMQAAKNTGQPMLETHAAALLPVMREADTLNYVVQNRLTRLEQGYSAEIRESRRFAASHDSGVGESPSLLVDRDETLGALRGEIERARAETKVEASMMTLLGAALLAEVQRKSERLSHRVRGVFSSRSATHRRTEKSAEKRKQEIDERYGDFYDTSASDGQFSMEVNPAAPGSMTIPDLENRMDDALAARKPKYVARATRAAVDASSDFERVAEPGRLGLGRAHESVTLAPETFHQLNTTGDGSDPLIAPNHRLLRAGLTADRDIKLNDLKFSLTRDAREAIDAEYEKSTSWLNPSPGLTAEKVNLLTRTVDVIVLCKTAEEMLQAIHEAQRQHDELWRERRQRSGGQTAMTLERWAEAVERFES